MVALIKALQVLLALSILIILHEFGHFCFAKLFRIKVEKFYLFFDVGGRSLLKFKKGETEYGIGWLPLGGYCKIAGMIDESLDTESLSKPARSWEFRSRPAWQRLLVMAGGVLFNFIFAILVYSAIMGIWGKAYISNDGSQVYVNDLAYEMGFRTGDEILYFDDYHPGDFSMLQADLARRNVRKATVMRGADTMDIYIDRAMISDVLNSPGMFDLAIPFTVDSIDAGSPNSGSGIVRGDRIIALAGVPTPFLQDSRRFLATMAGGSIDATVLRGADTLSVPVSVDSAGRIGVFVMTPNISRTSYNALTAIPAGLELAGSTISGYVSDLGLLVKPSTGAYKSVGSFIAIGQIFPEVWDWYRFLNILALLSIMLGVMNLLPIPALDGGHIVLVLYEMISRRKPSDRFLIAMQYIGLFLIIALMVLAFGNDIGRLIR